jgi:hypothetical protein
MKNTFKVFWDRHRHWSMLFKPASAVQPAGIASQKKAELRGLYGYALINIQTDVVAMLGY